MRKTLLIGGVVVLVVLGAGCNNPPLVQAPTQIQTTGQTACKPSTYKPAVYPPNYSATDCEFWGFGKKIAITGLDQASCKRTSEFFVVDKNHVYKQVYDPGGSQSDEYLTLKQVDAASYVSLQDGYFKDKNHLYFDAGESVRTIQGVDLASVQVLGTHYLKDKNHVYFIFPEKSAKITALSGFDLPTLVPVQTEENQEMYFKDKNGVYFVDLNAGGVLNAVKSKIKEADVATFEALDSYLLARDKNRVYYEGKKVQGADPQTFVVLGKGYFKDNGSVFTIIGGFHRFVDKDGCSYELVGYTNESADWLGYSKDKNSVYYNEWFIEGSDPATFQVDGNRAFDKNGEYQGRFKKK